MSKLKRAVKDFSSHPVNSKLRELRDKTNRQHGEMNSNRHLGRHKKKSTGKLLKRRQRKNQRTKICRRVIDLSNMQPQDKISNLKTLAALLHSNDTDEQLQAALELRKLVSMDQDPPLQEVIDSGAVPQLLKLLESSDNHELQFESCWAITNLVSGTTKHTTAVLEYGAAETLVSLLKNPKVQLDVKEQAVWALGNIGGDGSDCRDMLLELDVMSTLLQMMLQPQKKWRRGKDIRPNLCEQKTVTLSINRLSPKVRKIMRLLRLRQLHNAVLIKLNKATLGMLKFVEPYIAYGYPSVTTIKKLVCKRGYLKVNRQRIPLNSNDQVSDLLSDVDIKSVACMINELYTCGPNFTRVSSSLWPFKLSAPRGGYRGEKRIHFIEGGTFGNHEDYINNFVSKMI